jgi:putative transposase
MPAKNSTKSYVENGYYHIYNRGVEKRVIFLDQQDYGVFLSYLKEYLLPKKEKELNERLSDPQISSVEKNKTLKSLHLNNFNQEITLIAYCLMPNHFHFFVKQKSAGSIDKFMNSLATRYTMYFNRKYKRVGSLYQDVYKAILIIDESHFLHLSRYIHKQALALQGDALQAQSSQRTQPSSYPAYCHESKAEWIHPEEILAYFSTTNPLLTYQSFVEQIEDKEYLEDLILEAD